MHLSQRFSQLHAQSSPFVLGNIWDVASARAFESNGYPAIGTSSHAVAMANGYNDGEELPFEVLLHLAKKVVESVKIPFTVDLEGGYARTSEGIKDNLTKLHDAGVAGFNIEDTIANGSRHFQPAGEFARLLSEVTGHISRRNLNLFVNVRTDGFLLGMPDALKETIKRIQRYQDTGADGIFVPCITTPADIREVVQSTWLPVNVMCMPDLPSFDMLSALGVKRISMGGFLFQRIQQEVGRFADAITKEKSFAPILF